jgi:hypothetical protein
MSVHRLKSNKRSASLFENFDSWLSTKDVAKLLALSPNAVRIMVCRRLLPAFRMNGRLRFRKSDCVSLLSHNGD